jgi:hypothetical protein
MMASHFAVTVLALVAVGTSYAHTIDSDNLSYWQLAAATVPKYVEAALSLAQSSLNSSTSPNHVRPLRKVLLAAREVQATVPKLSPDLIVSG